MRSRRARRVVAAGLVAVAALAGGAFAAAVELTSPSGDEPVFGPVELLAEVRGTDPIVEVVFYVDGSLVAKVSRPPFRARYDFGQSNTEHHVVVEATSLFGGVASDSVTTPTMFAGEQVDVELVQIYVTVAAAEGQPRGELQLEDVAVVDDTGQQMPITTFSPGGNVPLSGVLLVDGSVSMQGDSFTRAVAGAKAVATMLGAEDEVMIALFSDRLLRATEFTNERESLDVALAGTEAKGGSAVLDHLYLALNRLRSRLGRPVVILFSDGEDVSSVLDVEQIRWRARRSQATIYWIRLQPQGAGPRKFTTFWHDATETASQEAALAESVSESGGRILPIRSVDEARTALAEIFRELRAQYVLGFQPRNRRHDSSWRTISVVSSRPGIRLSARAGFLDE